MCKGGWGWGVDGEPRKGLTGRTVSCRASFRTRMCKRDGECLRLPFAIPPGGGGGPTYAPSFSHQQVAALFNVLKLTMRRPKERNYISALYPSDFVFVAVHMYSCVRVSLMTSLIYIRFFFSLLFSSSFFAVANWCCACSWPRWSRPPRIPQTKRTSQATHRPPNPLNRAQIAFFGCILFHAISLNFIAAAAYIFLSLRVFCHVIECSFYSLEQT